MTRSPVWSSWHIDTTRLVACSRTMLLLRESDSPTNMRVELLRDEIDGRITIATDCMINDF